MSTQSDIATITGIFIDQQTYLNQANWQTYFEFLQGVSSGLELSYNSAIGVLTINSGTGYLHGMQVNLTESTYTVPAMASGDIDCLVSIYFDETSESVKLRKTLNIHNTKVSALLDLHEYLPDEIDTSTELPLAYGIKDIGYYDCRKLINQKPTVFDSNDVPLSYGNSVPTLGQTMGRYLLDENDNIYITWLQAYGGRNYDIKFPTNSDTIELLDIYMIPGCSWEPAIIRITNNRESNAVIRLIMQEYYMTSYLGKIISDYTADGVWEDGTQLKQLLLEAGATIVLKIQQIGFGTINSTDTPIFYYSVQQNSKSVDLGDAYSKSEVNALLATKADVTDMNQKANSSDVYTKSATYSKTEVNNLLNAKANSVDVYTKSQIDEIVGNEGITIYVNKYTGSDSTGDGSQSSPFASIQKGIEAVITGHIGTIIVTAGTYIDNLFIDGKAIILRTENIGDTLTITGDDDNKLDCVIRVTRNGSLYLEYADFVFVGVGYAPVMMATANSTIYDTQSSWRRNSQDPSIYYYHDLEVKNTTMQMDYGLISATTGSRIISNNSRGITLNGVVSNSAKNIGVECTTGAIVHLREITADLGKVFVCEGGIITYGTVTGTYTSLGTYARGGLVRTGSGNIS